MILAGERIGVGLPLTFLEINMADSRLMGDLKGIIEGGQISFCVTPGLCQRIVEFLSRPTEFYRAFPEQIAKIRAEVREGIARNAVLENNTVGPVSLAGEVARLSSVVTGYKSEAARLKSEIEELQVRLRETVESHQNYAQRQCGDNDIREKEKSALRKELAELRDQLSATNNHNARQFAEKNDLIFQLEKCLNAQTTRANEFGMNIKSLKQVIAERNAKIAELTLRSIPVDKAKEFNNGGKTTGEQAEKSVEKSPGQKVFEAFHGKGLILRCWGLLEPRTRDQWERAAAGVKS